MDGVLRTIPVPRPGSVRAGVSGPSGSRSSGIRLRGVLDVRTFGGLEVRANGASLPLPTDARARELLAWLALHPGAHGRSALAGTLRPDVPEESARKTLRTAVYELRRALGPTAAAALSVGRDAIGLDDAHVRVDAREFARLCARGDLEAAVRLSRGELLAGLDADWVLRARDEHAAELAGCLGALAERAQGAGDLAQAIAWARRRLEVEPLSESAHRELVRLLAAAGDRAAALAAVDAFAARLRRELGLPPSPETRALVEEIRRERRSAPRPASVHAALPAPLARTVRPVGREDALRRLSAAWEDARSGALRLALVTGEPGIGKTTLVGEFCRRAHTAGAAILYGRCDEEPLLPVSAVRRGARAPSVVAAGTRARGVAGDARRSARAAAAGHGDRGDGRGRARRALRGLRGAARARRADGRRTAARPGHGRPALGRCRDAAATAPPHPHGRRSAGAPRALRPR